MTIDWLYSLRGYPTSLSPTGVVVAIFWFGGLLYLGYASWRQHPVWQKKHRRIFLGLLLFALVFGVVTLPWLRMEIPLPGASNSTAKAVLMLVPFSVVAWMLAAGLLGPVPAMFLAFVSGVFLGEWNTGLPMEPLVYATLAWGVAWAFWQPYRTRFYRLLRQPLFTSLLATLFYAFLFAFGALWLAGVNLESKLDFIFFYGLAFILRAGVALLVAGVIAQAVALWRPQLWGSQGPYEPSPLERSLFWRVSLGMAALMAVTMLSIVVVNWQLARQSARELITRQLETTAQIVSQSIPILDSQGKSILRSIAAELQLSDTSEQPLSDKDLQEALHTAVTKSAFFTALVLADDQGRVIASFPDNQTLSSEDIRNIRLIRSTEESESVVYKRTVGDVVTRNAVVAFYFQMPESAEGEKRYLIGYTNLDENPYNEVIKRSFQAPPGSSDEERSDAFRGIQSEIVILDENRYILYSSARDGGDWLRRSTPVTLEPTATSASAGENFENWSEGVYEVDAPRGERYLLVVSQAVGAPWAVLTLAPTRQFQTIALHNALPLAALIGLLAVVGVVGSLSLVRILTQSLRSLTTAAERIASGQLNQPLEVASVDEIGQLRRAFEYMRQRLQARMSELSRLLHTSQRIAATLKIEEAADAVLAAAYSPECAAVRIALSPEALPDDGGDHYPTRFGRGLSAKAYEGLDDQLLSLARKQSLIRFNQLSKNTALVLPKSPTPQSLLAVALRYETRFLGVLYIVYNTPHTFSDEETRYFSALGLQMAMAAYTARLYYMAEVRHQRLQAVLNASPDPILVTDNQERLILANAAARAQLGVSKDLHRPLEEVITEESLLTLLRREQPPPYSDEITLRNRVYFATVTGVKSNKAEIGRVCILRDITHFKELDTLKSEFVATVSHDLRVPLTLINGYLSMLEMVGQLNERQSHYTGQIRQGVQDMTQLVNNLLDLGRIEAGVGLQLQLTSVLDIVDAVANRWQPHAARKRITLTTDIAAGTPPLIEADPVLLDRALHNLVDNAIKYTPRGGSVVIFGRPSGDDKIILGVKDSGVGISPIDQPRLFERFFRIVRRDGGKEKGSGLGLAIVKSIVERHHGRVWVESQLGEGSTFFIELPLRQPDNTTDTRPIPIYP